MKKNKDIQENNSLNGLSERVIRIQKGDEDINALISEYIPFIKSSVHKVIGKHVTNEGDEMSIGLLAFDEAIKSYNAEKGPFLSFASWVIRRRIIDYLRKESRLKDETNFSDLSQNQLNQLHHIKSIENNQVENPIKLEIDALNKQLQLYDIEFNDLVAASPKAKKTKSKCLEAIRYVIDNPAILIRLRQSKRLPAKIFKEDLNIPRKFLDRHRKYIIAVVEILSGDYIYLKEYVSFAKKGDGA